LLLWGLFQTLKGIGRAFEAERILECGRSLA